MKRSIFLFFLTALCAFGLTVYDVQYSTSGPSPYDGDVIEVTGVVTGTGYSGDKYFIADPEGGPWRGVYVYDYSNSVSLGDYITITAEVDEYYDLTELKNVSAFSIDGTVTVPEPYITTISGIDESLEAVLIGIENIEVTTVDGDNWTISDGTGTIEVQRGFDYDVTIEVGTERSLTVGIVSYSYGEYILEPRSNSDAGQPDVITPDDSLIVDIADIQANPSGYDDVTIEGVITGPGGSTRADMLNAWIQDESGMGIMLFAYDMPTESSDFDRGNLLRVTGSITEYNGVTEVTDIAWEVLGTAELPDPLELDDVWSDATDYEGSWCEATGTLTDVYNTSGSDYNLTIDSDGGNSILARVWGSTGIDASVLSAGDRVTIRGVGSIYSSAFQLLPCMPEDIEFSTDTIPDTTTTDIVPIADIQADPTAFGQVTIEGVITIPAGATRADMLNAWIQDESGKGVQLFDYDMPSEPTHFERGARLRCTGTVDEYNGVTEITSFTYEYLGTDSLPDAADFDDIASIATDYEGTWVMVSGMVTDMWTAGGGDNIQVTSDGGVDVLIRVWETTGITTEVLVGDHVTAFGVGSVYADAFQLLPAMEGDIEVYTPPPPADEPMINVPKAVLAPSLGERLNIEYSVPIGYKATLRVFDRMGRSVATLFEGTASFTMSLNWDGKNELGELLPAGAYMLHLEAKSSAGSLEPATETVVIGSMLK